MADDVLTMIPGPTPVHERILEAVARPTTSHVAPSFVALYRECLADLSRIVMTGHASPFVVAGSGTLAMEMGLVNLLLPRDRLLVVSQGYFGDRWVQIADAFGFPCDRLAAEWGHAVPADRLAERVASGRYAAVAMTHADTSTGTAAPVAEYCERLRGREELVLLDGVCATAGLEERFDDWGLDVLVTGAQKALGAPPGVAILVASARALERRRSLERVPAYSADLLRWLPIMDNPGLYFSTPPVNEIVALRESMRLVLEEGLPQRFDRHRNLARAIRAGLAALGLELFTDASCRADTLSVVLYPEGVEDGAFRAEMGKRGVVVAGALGPIAGRAFRLGHMGNIGAPEVRRTLEAIEGSFAALGHGAASGAAMAAAAPFLLG